MSIKVIAFDMGGVMVRDFDIFPVIARQYHIEGKNKDLLSRMLWEMCRGYWSEDDFCSLFERQSGLAIAPPSGSLMLRGFQPRLDEPTASLVLRLKREGYRVVCATNTIKAHYEWHTSHGQYAMFDKVYASHLMHEIKPEKGFFRAIVRGEGVKPDEMFFTDDNMVNVIGAREEGIKSKLYVDAKGIEGALCGYGVRLPSA